MPISLTFTYSLIALVLTFTCGCIGDRGVAPVVAAPEHTLSRVATTPTVVLMAVGGSGQLQTTGYSLTGDSLALDSVAYQLESVSDTVRVRIDSNGAITALNPTSRTVQVNVFGFRGDVVQADRVMLQVTPQAVSGLTLSIQPQPSDSAVVSVGTPTTITPILRNPSTGAQVSNPAMRYRVKSTDLSAVAVFHPAIRMRSPNGSRTVQDRGLPILGEKQIAAKEGAHRVWVFADIDAYGGFLRDSVQYTLRYPLSGSLSASVQNAAVIVNDFGGRVDHRTMVLAPGATVDFFAGVDSARVSFTFDGPSPPVATDPPSTIGGAAGDVIGLGYFEMSQRRFVVPGMYIWTMKVLDGPAPWRGQIATGKILIK